MFPFWYVDRIEDIGATLTQAKDCEGPAVVCVKSDRDANLLIPEDMFTRFFEVYRGRWPDQARRRPPNELWCKVKSSER
jgi:hypothetical protein